MDRRLFLTSLGATATSTLAGCAQGRSIWIDNKKESNETPPQQQEASTPQPPDISLPGDPVRTQNDTLDVQDASALFESESQGFTSDADEYEFETEPQASFDQSNADVDFHDSSADLEVSADHVGTGRAFGLATASFQTAWEAPDNGRYRLWSSYSRHADILYDHPDNGEVSASFDTSLLATQYQEEEVISERTHPELQHKNGELREEVAEWFLEQGVSYLISTTFGLGLVARLVLGQIISNLIELDYNVGGSESEIYDVKHRVQPNYNDPIQLHTEFEATEGDVFIFELTPTLGFGFELEDSWWYQPTSIASFDWQSFRIEKV